MLELASALSIAIETKLMRGTLSLGTGDDIESRKRRHGGPSELGSPDAQVEPRWLENLLQGSQVPPNRWLPSLMGGQPARWVEEKAPRPEGPLAMRSQLSTVCQHTECSSREARYPRLAGHTSHLAASRWHELCLESR